tara:strand:- start:2320 stop:2682 length:363 start_codon:yes stop_codon:yes gene_type:complete
MTETADVTGMTFSLDSDLEDKFLNWLDEQNKLIVEEQQKSEEFGETQKAIQKKTLETGAPMPIYDINSGYYSVSFTPVAWGNRIFVHNHFTGKSFKLFDYEDFQEATAKNNDEQKESSTL